MTYTDIACAQPDALERLARWLGCEATVGAVCDELGIERHVCSFEDFGWPGEKICWGCGEVR